MKNNIKWFEALFNQPRPKASQVFVAKNIPIS